MEIIVKKEDIPRLRESSNFFNGLIRFYNERNSNVFDKNGNLIIRRDKLGITARAFNALQRAINDAYIHNQPAGNFVKDYFGFERNYNDPTIYLEQLVNNKNKTRNNKNRNSTTNNNNNNNFNYLLDMNYNTNNDYNTYNNYNNAYINNYKNKRNQYNESRSKTKTKTKTKTKVYNILLNNNNNINDNLDLDMNMNTNILYRNTTRKQIRNAKRNYFKYSKSGKRPLKQDTRKRAK